MGRSRSQRRQAGRSTATPSAKNSPPGDQSDSNASHSRIFDAPFFDRHFPNATRLWRSTTRRRSTAVLATVAAVLLAITEVTSAIDTLGNGVRSLWEQVDPPAAQSPATVGDLKATIENVQLVERDVSLGTVYSDRGLTPDPILYRKQDLAKRGQLFRYHCTFSGGFLDRELRVTWTLFDATTQQVVRADPWKTVNAIGWPNPGWRVQSNTTDSADGELWVPNVADGDFKVLIRLVDDQGTEVASGWTDPYSVDA